MADAAIPASAFGIPGARWYATDPEWMDSRSCAVRHQALRRYGIDVVDELVEPHGAHVWARAQGIDPASVGVVVSTMPARDHLSRWS